MPARNFKSSSKMNTNPDETKLALWLEDELVGKELADFEALIAGREELHAQREEARLWRQMMSSEFSDPGDVPYPEFFNHRILRSIRDLETTSAAAVPTVSNNVLSPEAIIIGGGISLAGDDLILPLQDFLDLYEWRPGGKKTPVKLAQFSDLAGAIGAAGFAMSKSK